MSRTFTFKDTERIGKELRKMRVENNFGSNELARTLRVSSPLVCSWESGRARPSLETLVKLAKVYRMDLGDLVKRIMGVENK